MADFLSSVGPRGTKPLADTPCWNEGAQREDQQPVHPEGGQAVAVDIAADLLCPICEEVVYQPVRTVCDHLFCLACLSIWLEQSTAKSCPLCRRALCAAGQAHARASAHFAVDAELEQRARAALGPQAYSARALDALGPELGRKLEAYRRKQERLASGSGVACAGLSLGALTVTATVWGAGAASYLGALTASAQAALASGGVGLLIGAPSVAGVAFWSTALSADVLADAVFAGALAGVGTSAFLWGMKFAAWFDGQGKYCILRGCPAPEPGGQDDCIRVLNLLDGSIVVRAFAARKKRHRGSVLDYVAESAGIADRQRSGWTLAAEGEPLAELCVGSRREELLRLPEGAPRRLLLAVTLQGLVLDRDVGLCCARRGQRFVVGEIDGPAGKVFRRWSEAHAEYRSVTAGGGASSGSASGGAERASVLGIVHEAVGRLFSADEAAPREAQAAAAAEGASPRSFLDGRGSGSPSAAPAGGSGAGAAEQDEDGMLASLSRLLGLDRADAGSEEAEEETTSEEEEGEAEAAGEAQQPPQQWQRKRWDERRSSVRRSVPSARPSAQPGAWLSTRLSAQPGAWPSSRPSARPSAVLAAGPAAAHLPRAAARLWIGRHGVKECKHGRPSNWHLLLTSAGAAEVEAGAQRLAAQGASGGPGAPRRIVCSPFPRCVVTAGIYARVLGLPSVCVEPGLCEVLTPSMGARGLPGPRPAWTEAELLGLLAASGAERVQLDTSYVPAVRAEELHSVECETDRSEVEERVGVLASHVEAGTFDGCLLVTHGSPAYRLVRALTGERSFAEPPMGSIVELVGCPGGGGSWGRVESFECPSAGASCT